MRASRLLSILILLQLRTRVTAQALAAEFGVTERTIYRDIDELSAAGVPVYGERGAGGGFQLLGGWRTQLTGLLPDEAETLALIGLPGAASQLGLGPSAQRLQHKLLAALPGDKAALAGRLAERFHVDPVDWYRGPEPAPQLPVLARAVLDQQAVQVHYDGWRGRRVRVLHPLGLVLKAGAWYAVALNAGGGAEALTYKVAAMHDLQVLPQRFVRPRPFRLAVHWAASVQRFEAGLRPGTALLRASPEGCRRLAEKGAFAQAAVAAAEPEAAGPGATAWARVKLPIENEGQATLLVLSLGAEAQVLQPEALRRRVAEEAAAVARLHRTPARRRH